jgi:hypothetical protein
VSARTAGRISGAVGIERLPGPARAGLLVACLAAWSGCGPPPPIASLETLEARSRQHAERRERKVRQCEAHAVLRLETPSTGRLPAVAVTARLASPDRARLQARWVLGTLVDAVLTGDTLRAWMPTRRLGLDLPGFGDTLGLPEPGRILRQALAASWPAPRSAWREAVADSAGASLAWSEAGEDWTLRLDRAGRPREVTWSRAGKGLHVRYAGWRGRGSGAWPTRLELSEPEGAFRLQVAVEDVRALKRVPPSVFSLVLPDGVRPFGFDDLRRALALREDAP